MAAYTEDQRYVRNTILSTILTALMMFAIGWYVYPALPEEVMSSITGRLLFTLRYQCLAGIMLIAPIVVVANIRFNTTAINPMNPSGQDPVAIHNRVIQNTLEQFVMLCIGQFGMATYLSGPSMKVIPILVFIFIVGRIFFWIGYPQKRAFGMALTFFTTYSSFGYFLFCLFYYGPGYKL